MVKRALTAVFAGALVVLTFVAVSSARSTGRPDLPPGSPANAIPIQQVDDQTAITIADAIGPDAASTFGIDADAVHNVRVLTTTSRGPVYIVTGAGGECLVLAFAASCGDLRQDASVSVFVADAVDPNAVGAGIAARGSVRVHFVTPSNRVVPTHPIIGGFALGNSDGVALSAKIVVEG